MTQLLLLPGMDGTGELFAPLLRELPLELSVSLVAYPDRAATYDEHVAVARRPPSSPSCARSMLTRTSIAAHHPSSPTTNNFRL